jgi:phage terminase small subunit
MPARPRDRSADYFHHAGTFKAPPGLPRGAQTLWRRIMATTPEDQFRAADLPLLALFCRVSLLAGEAVAHLEQGQVDAGGKVSPWVRISSDHSKTLAALSAKLRLAPSSRLRAEAHSLQQRPAHVKPWQWGDRDPLRDLDDDLLAR